ncbi:MAG: peptide chain release factor aRF-1 [Euryarchaeota archaeon]|nr:peptide chain release factor aRF-1 [Euryarchaeota archaeon]
MEKNIRKHKLKKMIERISEYRGRNTELVSLYIPAEYPLPKVAQMIKDEAGTASNIKSKSTRKNVLAALEKITQHLKLYKQTPENGLIIFCGNISSQQGNPDYHLFSLEPPEPISTSLYRCDQEFVVEPLSDLVEERNIYGLLIVERNEATIGTLKGKRVKMLDNMTSGVPGKTRAGGQSAARFERLREIADHEFRERIGKHMNNFFLDKLDDIDGIIVGGPGLTKNKFIDGDFLDYRLNEKIIDTYNTVYTEEYGLRELVDKASDSLQQLEIREEKEIMKQFFAELLKKDELTAYGEEEIRHALTIGAVEHLLLSEKLDLMRVTLRCTCDYEKTVTKTESELRELEEELSAMQCPNCGNSRMKIKEKIEIEEEFVEMAESIGATVHFISTETEEGNQLLKAFGGIAAILRFNIGVK